MSQCMYHYLDLTGGFDYVRIPRARLTLSRCGEAKMGFVSRAGNMRRHTHSYIPVVLLRISGVWSFARERGTPSGQRAFFGVERKFAVNFVV